MTTGVTVSVDYCFASGDAVHDSRLPVAVARMSSTEQSSNRDEGKIDNMHVAGAICT
jgi:hypothetical protein